MPAAAQLTPWLTAYLVAAAACVGSFLNVVIARLPAGQSLIRPRSRCPRCLVPIRWYDNVPVVSWLALGGRCRSCRARISARYPLVEVLVALLGLALFRKLGLTTEALGFFAFACALVALAYIDLDTWLLPHEITWPLLASGLLSPLWNPELPLRSSALGAGLGVFAFAAIALFGERVLRRELMGWGDVWLLGGIGAWLGWESLLPVVLLASVQGAAVGALILLVRGRGRDGAPAEGERADLAARESGASTANAAPTAGEELPASASPPAAQPEEGWTPPPHAVPFGPFLALAALEQLLLGDLLASAWIALVGRLLP